MRPEEIESLVCGSAEPLDFDQLRAITLYDAYNEHDEVIKWFWSIVIEEFSEEQRKRLLMFTTGSDRVPIGGVKDMSFKITRVEAKNQ